VLKARLLLALKSGEYHSH